jgi:hypothetical protein
LRDAETTEPRLDDHGLPRLFFRSTGNPLVGLDLTGASQLRQMLAHAGQAQEAQEIDAHINFDSKKALRTKIEEFIAYFNRTMAKPFRWTMEAKPLTR